MYTEHLDVSFSSHCLTLAFRHSMELAKKLFTCVSNKSRTRFVLYLNTKV